MWMNEVTLISKCQTEPNEIGDLVEVLEKRIVFCCEKSISQSEFYQAQAQGLKPQLKLIVKVVDYNNEEFIEYDGVRYHVLRTFKSSSEDIELILEGDIYGAS